MMIINAEQWIITSHDSDEYTYHDPFYPHIENNYRDEYRELDDIVTLLEKVIRTLSIEIEKLNKQLQNKTNIDISAISNIDFWLTEEDDAWDTL